MLGSRFRTWMLPQIILDKFRTNIASVYIIVIFISFLAFDLIFQLSFDRECKISIPSVTNLLHLALLDNFCFICFELFLPKVVLNQKYI